MAFRRLRNRARDIGGSLTRLGMAEVAALRADLRQSARQAGIGGVLTVAGVAAVLGAGAALAVAGFEALVLVLPRWGAALAVAGTLLVCGAVLLLVGMRYWRRFESPLHTVQRRFEDHLQWWQGLHSGRPGATCHAAATAPDDDDFSRSAGDA